MKDTGWVNLILLFVFIMPFVGCSKKKDGNEAIYKEVICFGGDAIESADLTVKPSEGKETVRLVLDTMGGDSKSFKATLETGSFRRMIDQGRIEILMPSEKHPLTIFGGETAHAALVDLFTNKKGDLKGFLALEGSVFEVWCPKNPMEFIGK